MATVRRQVGSQRGREANDGHRGGRSGEDGGLVRELIELGEDSSRVRLDEQRRAHDA